MDVLKGGFDPDEMAVYLREWAKLKPVGVAIIAQFEDDPHSVAVDFYNMPPASLQLGIRLLQLQADKDLEELSRQEGDL